MEQTSKHTNMKTVFLVPLLVILLGFQLQAQTVNTSGREVRGQATLRDASTGEIKEYKVRFNNARDRKVVVAMFGSKVTIEGYNGDEVVVQGAGGKARPERAEGLRAVYNSAEDNSGIGLSVTQEGNTIRVTRASREGGNYTIRVPRNVHLVYDEVNWHGGGDVNIANIDGEVEVSTKVASMNLTNVAGPVVASSTSGNITVRFANVRQEKPSSLSNISGFIDVAMPANAKANLKLKSITGEIYTDFDLGLKKGPNDLQRIGGGHNVEGSTNGGGVEINLKTISSDIYVRKNK
ncbi:hypothetical protein BH24BAC1_BH24BAC1_03980 [soil metagenome]